MVVSQTSNRESNDRPLGIVLVVYLFVVFAIADAVILLADGDSWWIISLCFSILLGFLFRRLWFGDDRERRIGVFFGFFVAALNIACVPDKHIGEWSVEEYAYSLEAIYAFCAAIYLMLAKQAPFFCSRKT